MSSYKKRRTMEITLNPNEEMDVRVLEPIERHKQLLGIFKNLPVKESFTFINDHDPIPLYYEFKSVCVDVMGWEYLKREGRDWKVRVRRTEASQAEGMKGVDTLIDLRKTDKKHWKQVVFHRFGMMQSEEIMQLNSRGDPNEIQKIFETKFASEHIWKYIRETPGDYIIHVQKTKDTGMNDTGFALINEIDLRPFPPTERHEMFYKAFADIKPGEAFNFYNDHDPKPLYYQMEVESKEAFSWDYLEEGSEVWKVRVTKLKE